ncbi:GntR family transcriptional regulator [Sessilibacter corallicola]|uniref:GntR family transcriptional regulator n=1 Tax=Sessilibacter corallicola TaxID=2904075 RepID=A0ABQ0A9R6_9GAMM|nr:GntR family transcriptional regulator [Sessilibacter corallicola]MCE2029342.1 GntR family transcriptional regulator [Sessilibacter corallicola]
MAITDNATPENTLASNITQTLRDAIVCGDIEPGSKLSEPKLAKEYNVSRGPLREAIRRLESMKLVKYVPHGGARVITLELPQVIEIYHIREALEGKAAALAARNIDNEGISKLKELLVIAENHMAATGGAYIQAEADIDFHYCVIQASGNQMLIHTLCEELYYLVRMYRYKSSLQPSRSSQAFKEHQLLFQALEQKDEQLAELIMRKHIVRARENIEQQLLNN